MNYAIPRNQYSVPPQQQQQRPTQQQIGYPAPGYAYTNPAPYNPQPQAPGYAYTNPTPYNPQAQAPQPRSTFVPADYGKVQAQNGYIAPAEPTQVPYIPPPKERPLFPYNENLQKYYKLLFSNLQTIAALKELLSEDIQSDEIAERLKFLEQNFDVLYSACNFNPQTLRDFINHTGVDLSFVNSFLDEHLATKAPSNNVAGFALGEALTKLNDYTHLQNLPVDTYKTKWLSLKNILLDLNIMQNNSIIKELVEKWIAYLHKKSGKDLLSKDELKSMEKDISTIRHYAKIN